MAFRGLHACITTDLAEVSTYHSAALKNCRPDWRVLEQGRAGIWSLSKDVREPALRDQGWLIDTRTKTLPSSIKAVLHHVP